MPNPYHDADGKFCSRDGMRESIQNLIKDNRINEALKLTEELKSFDDESESKHQDNFTAAMQAKTNELVEERVTANITEKEQLLDDFYWNNLDGPEKFVNLLDSTGSKTSPEDEVKLRSELNDIRRDAYDNGVAVEMAGDSPKRIDSYKLADEILDKLECKGQVHIRARNILADAISDVWDANYAEGAWDT